MEVRTPAVLGVVELLEQKLTRDTHVILQGYVSRSVYTHDETDLDELLADKYQLSVGIYHYFDCCLVSFAFTENVRNFNNTPDIGFQLGVRYSPSLRARRR